MSGEPTLAVSDLAIDLALPDRTIHAVRGLSYDLARGEALGIVGESGSGKTTSALALLGLLPKGVGRVVHGSMRFEGRELVGASTRELQSVRGAGIAMVFQDPLASLNPVMPIGRQISEALGAHKGLSGAAARTRTIDLLAMVGIASPKRRVEDYPHQFSGGMRQRVMLAMALSCEPALLVADEPTTALDVTIQAQILDLLNRLRRELRMTVLIISHDLGVVADVADRVAVMYAGRIVEIGSTNEVIDRPRHPYTIGLLQSIPRLDRPRTSELSSIEGGPPDLSKPLRGCPFRPRCAWAIQRCEDTDPSLEPVGGGHSVACWVKPHQPDAVP
ncbi:MAG TPA: ABC transporter ATP-binding protein [Candidatus Limnocylindrales bacterium]|nr:ABC transporter ATP-binding protein [Candidatus Limnocylindrales bacterium]